MIELEKVEQSQANLEHLWIQWKEHELQYARNALAEHYLPLVDFVMNRVASKLPHTVSRDDLKSLGSMGLLDAMDKFDHKRGLKFETYASWRIRGAILDGLRQTDWVPRSIRERSKTIEDAYQVLEQTYLRNVTDEEVSMYLDISVDEFRKTLQEISITTLHSLEDPIGEEEAEIRLHLLEDEQAKKPEEKVHELYLKDMLATGIERLTDKERIVVSLFYYEDLSLSEIARVMELSPSRISQLHSKAISRLKNALQTSKEQLLYNH